MARKRSGKPPDDGDNSGRKGKGETAVPGGAWAGFFNALTIGLKVVVELAKGDIADAPAVVRAVLRLAGLIAVVCLVGAASLAVLKQPIPAFVLALVVVVLVFIVAVVLLGSQGRTPFTEGSKASVVQHSERKVLIPWARVVPKLPISADAIQALRSRLEAIRNAAFAWLSEHYEGQGVKPAEVRANVFLPDFGQTASGDVCDLFMPDRLRVGMDGAPDENIRFRPRQGLTGLVFIEQQPRVAQSLASREGQDRWEEIYQLTPDQKRQIHPDLCWIVSFPLLIPDRGQKRAGGVLNVDGLVHQLPKNMLDQLMAHLSLAVADFADELARLPKMRVKIELEDVSNGGIHGDCASQR